jgi:hypothetical protein
LDGIGRVILRKLSATLMIACAGDGFGREMATI